MGGFILLYYIILVLMSLRFIFNFKRKNLFNKIWGDFFGKVVRRPIKGYNFGN